MRNLDPVAGEGGILLDTEHPERTHNNGQLLICDEKLLADRIGTGPVIDANNGEAMQILKKRGGRAVRQGAPR